MLVLSPNVSRVVYILLPVSFEGIDFASAWGRLLRIITGFYVIQIILLKSNNK